MADEVEVILRLLQKYHFTNAEAALKAELLAREREGSPLSSSDSVLDWGMELRLDALQAVDHLVASDHTSPHAYKRELYENASDQSDKAEGTSLSRSPPEKHLFIEFESGKFQKPGSELIPAQELAFNNIRALPKPDAAPSPPSAISNSVISIFQFESAPSQESFQPDSSSIQSSGWVDQGKEGVIKGLSTHLPQERKMRQLTEDKQVLDNKGKSSRELITGHILDICSSGFENELVQQHINGEIQGETDSYRTGLLKIENEGYLKGCSLEGDSMCQDNGLSTRSDASGNDSTRVERGSQCQQALHGIGSASEGPRNDGSKISSRYDKGVRQIPPLKTSLPLGLSDYTQNDNAQGSVADYQGSFIDNVVASRVLEQVNGGAKVQEAEAPSSERERTRGATVEDAEESRLLTLTCLDEPEGLARLSPRPEELPKLPHVKLRSVDRNIDHGDSAEVGFQATESAAVKSIGSSQERSFAWDAFSGGPMNEDLPSAGLKWPVSRPSVSQGIVEDMPDMLSGFAIAGDDERGFPDDYCDSDTYEDDDDPGYHRQPIEDEEWFYAHEIDYPSDDERAGQYVDKNNQTTYKQSEKVDEDDQLFVEEEAYFSGEEYYKSQVASQASKDEASKLELRTQGGRTQPKCTDLYSTANDSGVLSQSREADTGYGGKLFDAEEISKMRSEPVWQGFMSQSNELRHVVPGMTGDFLGNVAIDDEHLGSVRSGGVALSSDAADVGSELRDSLVGGSSEGDVEGFRDQEFAAYRPGHGNFHLDEIFDEKVGRHLDVKCTPVRHTEDEDEEDQGDMILHFYNEAWGHTKRVEERYAAGGVNKRETSKTELVNNERLKNCGSKDNGVLLFEGFSFPSPASTGDIPISRAGSGKSLWSNRESGGQDEETDGCGSGIVGPDDTLAAWKRKSNGSSPIVCPSEGNLPDLGVSNRSTLSINSSEEFVSLEARDNSDFGCLPESCQPLDQDEGAVQEEISRLSAEEDQYEIFNLRIIHRKNRTGFEEEKDLSVVLNSVIAGRYHVTEYLGSAAFSKAIQAHDLHTGMDVCMKIIKNNKDFFDQSLDEIKLLKYVNRHDPADKYHILRLYDYFYHREHLFIVCELLRANLYEFHKFNRESGGEVYFTMSRLQSITRQCLEALEFLHKLGIIHCDLKPENILVKSYSRCEIKIIDLGSSCFQTDHLCSYVQSRSYRAPEVILGLPYDQKIDIWSLGCILAELCSGNVLFQNDSLATLLARVVGILGPIDPDVLAKGKDTHKYFTKNHTLYEKNQETDQLEYLLPKKTSLRHRLPMGDAGFVEFVGYLLQNNPVKRPTASEALKHPWLSYPYEPISS